MGTHKYRRRAPDRMDGDPVSCERCGAVVQPEFHSKVCHSCSRVITSFTQGTTYLVVSDPTNTYPRGGHHKDPAFEQSLRFGYWPEGMTVEIWKNGRPVSTGRVSGPECPADREKSQKPQVLVRTGGPSVCRGDGVYLTQRRKKCLALAN